MNPYDFVPIDIQYLPDRRKPIWHHILKDTAKLYSGRLSIAITTETPLFIPDTEASMQDPANPAEHIYNNAGTYIIPGSSLKGLLRSVVETLCSGCLKMLSLPVGYEKESIPSDFEGCQNNQKLCIACRIFGMTPESQRNSQVFLGKVNIGDALVSESSMMYEPIYTAILEAPKPRHRAFYLNADRRFIAGRKFYFHHYGSLNTENRLIPIRNEPGRYRNQYIEPLDIGTTFNADIDFTNLEADEFAALLLAITLKPDMRHKIGYGKPIGLGSIHMILTKLRLIDYAARYTTQCSEGGISSYNQDELIRLTQEQMAPFGEKIHTAWQDFSGRPALHSLQTIWGWQPNSRIVYEYPSHDWFAAHSQARIAETWNL